jgi:hypothetical protein
LGVQLLLGALIWKGTFSQVPFGFLDNYIVCPMA